LTIVSNHFAGNVLHLAANNFCYQSVYFENMLMKVPANLCA